MKARLVYARSRTIGGWLIRAAQWWSPHSHVALMGPEGLSVIHSLAFRGVVEDSFRAFLDRYHVHDIVDVEVPDTAKAAEWARAQIGKKYDYGALARFVSRLFGKDSPDRFHCVELVEGALAAAGRPRFRVPLHKVTVRQSYIVA